MKQKTFLAYLLLGTILLGAPPHSQAATQTTKVLMQKDSFSPQTITINQGDTVVFENVDAQDRWPASNIHPTHEIYPEFDPKKPIPANTSWQFTFNKAGTWKYHDHLLPTISGTVVVTDNLIQTANPTIPSKPEGFFSRVWHSIKNWWMRIWHKPPPQRKTPDEKFDENIQVNDENIFQDDSKLAAYIHKYGPKQTIAELHALEAKFGSCHQPAHRAGHLGYQQLGDHALIEYSPECQSGYYHGVMEAYFKDHGADNLKESFTQLCPSNLNNFFEHQCIHGIGHGLLAWTNYELPEALAACDQLPKRQDSCWTGVFMENLSAQIANGNKTTSAGNTDVHLTKYLKNDDALYPCDGVETKYQSSCYFLQTSRMLQIFGQDFKKVADACATAPDIYHLSCFGSMGRDVGGNFPTNNQRQIQECGHAKADTDRVACLNGAVQNSFWDPSGQTQAIDFCKKLANQEEKGSCYSTIIDRAGQLLTVPDDITKFCSNLENEFLTTCQAQLTHVLR